MTNSSSARPFIRAINTAFAVALTAFLLANYWPIVKVFDLSRAELQVQGEWIGGHAKRITAVTPGGVADRAGIKPGDMLEFDPGRDSDWVLAGYRNMPEGFSGTLPVRRADGSRAVVTLEPERVAYLSTLNDRMALLTRLVSLTLMALVGVFMVWMRPGVLTWSVLLIALSGLPARIFADYYLGFEAGPGVDLMYFLPSILLAFAAAFLPFALSFPRNAMVRWRWWQRSTALLTALLFVAFVFAKVHIQIFEGPVYARGPYLVWTAVAVLIELASIAVLMQTYRQSDGQVRARLKWAMLGVGIALASVMSFAVFIAFGFVTADVSSGNQITPGNWVIAVSGMLFVASFSYAVLRERVVDVQFAMSRTLVYGAVSTLVVVFLAVLHWLFGRMIEHSGLAFSLEGLAAIGLGLVLHRASHGITVLVDRVLFRKHHQAEERLRRVTAALPFADDERAIAEALVTEPARNLDLASAALFYRESPEGLLKRVLAQGWNDAHAASLEADALLVRYLQAEHEPLKLDDSQLLPDSVPSGAAQPVLAIPIVNQHVLAAVVLYGAHRNHTLLDPDEIELLHQLAKAAATSHQQVRIAILQRENAALSRKTEGLERENLREKVRNDRLEALVQTRMMGPGERI
jgi:hypothetical protein